MCCTASILALIIGAIPLDGVVNTRLVARTSFDSNNVRLGEPMTLNLDFVGADSDLSELHPPSLAKAVDRSVWRVDDMSAKTVTDVNSRRVTYRVRPVKEGVQYFPALDFEYLDPHGVTQKVTTAAVPVRVKPGTQAALLGLEDSEDGLPTPDGITVAVTSVRLTDDETFRWRKACRKATAEAFAAFDFPEARMNEAAAHTMSGNWAKALSIYSSLEWRIGQTVEMERGIIAALARKHDSAAAELPAWRQVMRPVLRFGWLGRMLALVGVLGVMMFVVWLCGRMVRIFASIAVLVMIPLAASAQSPIVDPFDEMDRHMQQLMMQMQQMGGMRSSMTINGQAVEPDSVKTSVQLSKADISVGEEFEFIVAIETTKSQTVSNLNLQPSEMFGLVATGSTRQLANGSPSSPSNTVVRYAVPVRYDVPFQGNVSFRVSGMVEGRKEVTSRYGRQSFSFSQSFSDDTVPIKIVIKPLPTDGQPSDFKGIIGSNLRLREAVDRTRVETNDVVTVTCTLEHDGFVPPGTFDDEVARRPRQVRWRSYFVADGSDTPPPASVVYYDPVKRKYETVTANPPRLMYVAAGEEESGEMAVDAGGAASEANGSSKTVTLRFAPSDSATVVGKILLGAVRVERTEEYGEWVRVDDGTRAGWVRKEELQ